jgi:succinoglycan biosynthesis protein ExoA
VAQMTGHYVPRDSLRSLARQHFRYGFYRARTFRRHPRSMRLSHVLAPALAMSAVCAVAGPRRPRALARAGIGVYLVSLAASAAGARDASASERALLLAVLPTMHLGWGFGTLAGVARFGPPVAAIRQAIARGSRNVPSRPDGRVSVYAPSLHDSSG